MFFGKHSQTLDEKNRLRIPKEFRNKLGNEIVIGRGLYGCLFIYSAETFERLFGELYEIDTFDAEKEQAMTTFLSRPAISQRFWGISILPCASGSHTVLSE